MNKLFLGLLAAVALFGAMETNAKAQAISCPGYAKTSVYDMSWTVPIAPQQRYAVNMVPGEAVIFRFTVPANALQATHRPGWIAIYEYIDSPVMRWSKLSEQPCDFYNGQFGAQGVETSHRIVVNPDWVTPANSVPFMLLTPGKTYYVNVTTANPAKPGSKGCANLYRQTCKFAAEPAWPQ